MHGATFLSFSLKMEFYALSFTGIVFGIVKNNPCK